MNYLLHLVIYFEIYAIVALSLNLVAGYCGLLSLAHAAYFAVGAYTYSLMALIGGWSFIPAAAFAIVISSLLSLAVSLPAWRLRGDFFVLSTLAVQALIFSALYNWSDPNAALGTWQNLTNGPFGIAGIPRPNILGWVPASAAEFAVFATGMTTACVIILWQLQRSPWGRLLIAVRDDELAARALGKNTRIAKVQAVAISSGLAALAGALYASYVRYLDPSSATIDESIMMLSMVVIGGMGNFRGPIVGAITVVALPELLRLLQLPDTQAAHVQMLVYGCLLALMMHLRPSGLAGSYRIQ